jgi:hypothetical protein
MWNLILFDAARLSRQQSTQVATNLLNNTSVTKAREMVLELILYMKTFSAFDKKLFTLWGNVNSVIS